MPADLPVPIALATARAALSRLFIDLAKAFYASIFPLGTPPPGEMDANLALVAVAVMLGHAQDRPLTASGIAVLLNMPRSSVLARLNVLIGHGLITRIDGRYYLDANRAGQVPFLDAFELILSKAFAVLGPHLSESDS